MLVVGGRFGQAVFKWRYGRVVRTIEGLFGRRKSLGYFIGIVACNRAAYVNLSLHVY